MVTKNVEVYIYSKRLNPKKGLILEIKNSKARYYDLDCRITKETELKEKEIESFVDFIEKCGFYKLEDNYGINLEIEGDFDTPQEGHITVKTDKTEDKKKTVSAGFCYSLTPGSYNAIIWEAIKFNQAKAGHKFF